MVERDEENEMRGSAGSCAGEGMEGGRERERERERERMKGTRREESS
jgi:hypothetical protein